MPPMRAAIRRALASPPPRGAVVVVVLGLLITIAAILLSSDPGGSGEDVPYKTESEFPDSPTIGLDNGGNAKIVDGVVSSTADNDFGQRLYRIEASLRARAGAGAKIDQVRCQLQFPKGVHIGISDGRDAGFPRPLEDSADDAIKEAASVDFETDDSTKAAVGLRNAFFKYVVGGDPSVSWPNLTEGQQSWLWRYLEPVQQTRVNFAVVLLAKGGQTVPIVCTPAARTGTRGTPARTSVKLPD
jgi:hypothetical protein